MVILGVDPGVISAGFSVLRHENGLTELVDCGCTHLRSSQPLPERLAYLQDFFSSKITQWHVTDLILETPFLGKNAQNFLKLGYVRGVLYVLVHRNQLRLREFSPREVKRALTGFGAADKSQVARVVLRLFPGLAMPERYDVTDAVALSLCGLWAAPGSPRLSPAPCRSPLPNLPV